MKKITLSIFLLAFLLGFVACKDDTISPLQIIEVKIAESFIIDGPAQLSFINFEEENLMIEVRNFSEHFVKGLVSARTYVDLDIIDDKRTNYKIEAGYEDSCHGQSTGGLCNEIRFDLKDQRFILKFEEVYWSEVKENREGTEFIEVDSARLIVIKE